MFGYIWKKYRPVKFGFVIESDVGRTLWDWIGASLYYCKTLENGDEESMLVMTKTAHCIFLRERRLRVPTENREKALCARALAV